MALQGRGHEVAEDVASLLITKGRLRLSLPVAPLSAASACATIALIASLHPLSPGACDPHVLLEELLGATRGVSASVALRGRRLAALGVLLEQLVRITLRRHGLDAAELVVVADFVGLAIPRGGRSRTRRGCAVRARRLVPSRLRGGVAGALRTPDARRARACRRLLEPRVFARDRPAVHGARGNRIYSIPAAELVLRLGPQAAASPRGQRRLPWRGARVGRHRGALAAPVRHLAPLLVSGPVRRCCIFRLSLPPLSPSAPGEDDPIQPTGQRQRHLLLPGPRVVRISRLLAPLLDDVLISGEPMVDQKHVQQH
mmetsp:Transcript_128074/g.370693  ORF Transcript_128074/g.370693 Transcript_128074/m.370693 type:complete len:314 (-) Transcript_128074:735-1676(-)